MDKMDKAQLLARKQGIIARFGAWTADDIRLTEGVSTLDAPPRFVPKLRRALQIVADAAGRPLDQLRVLDLGCLEGLYAVEFALHGAQVVALEGREGNLEKTRLAKDALGLDNLELVLDDVRNLSVEKYGRFDAVLCLGILYHLDAPAVFDFVRAMHEVCDRVLVVDTHISLFGDTRHAFEGVQYGGRVFIEHLEDAAPEERLRSVWASLDNTRSFWLTRPSLFRLLHHVGFSSVLECHIPPEATKPEDRITLLAFKGERQKLLAPTAVAPAREAWPPEPNRTTEGRRFFKKWLQCRLPPSTATRLGILARRFIGRS